MKHQVKAIWPHLDCHIPYVWKTYERVFELQVLTTDTTRHVVQDVLTPFAVLVAAAIKRVLQDQADKTDIMPFIQEVFCFLQEGRNVLKLFQTLS